MGSLTWKSERVQVVLEGRDVIETEELSLKEGLRAWQVIGSLSRKESGIMTLISWRGGAGKAGILKYIGEILVLMVVGGER